MYEDEDFGGQRDYKAERDSLIDDIAVLRANNKRLEQELKTRREETDNLEAKLSAQLSMKRDLEKENKHLKEINTSLHNNINEKIRVIETLKQIRDLKDSALKGADIKIKTLERELSAALNGKLATYDKLQEYVLELQGDLSEYQKENEKLNNVANEAIDLAESENEKYTKLTQHIRQKAEANPSVSRYIALVNYIDRLEKGES